MTDGMDQDKKGAVISLARSRMARHREEDVVFALHLDNLVQIGAAFGEGAAQFAFAEAGRLVCERVGGGGAVRPSGNGSLEVKIWDRGLLGPGPVDIECPSFLQSLCSAIALTPLAWKGERLHVSLSGSWSAPSGLVPGARVGEGRDFAVPLAWFRFAGDPVGKGAAWATQYRRDMARVATLFAAIDNERCWLEWQGICGGVDAADILYHEAMLRCEGERGDRLCATELLPSLERLGFVRVLDHHVVSRVIDELDDSPGVVLGVNISAQSAVLDGWWNDLFARLYGRPDLSRRLVIEITETSPFASISEAAAFSQQMRRLGCRIALDDFGAGYASIRQLFGLAPDIVKVDAFFLDRAARSPQDRAAFDHLFGIAAALAPLVVVEGVETEAQARVADEAGAMWRQGYHFGRPTMVRPWRTFGGRAFADATGAVDWISPQAGDPKLVGNGGWCREA